MSLLTGIPEEKLPAVWCWLNSWTWHPLLPENPDFNALTHDEKYKVLTPIMNELQSKVSWHDLCKEWNCVSRDSEPASMTEEEFDTWWTQNRL